MLTLSNNLITLAMSEDAGTIVLEDRARGEAWRLRGERTISRSVAWDRTPDFEMLPPGRVERRGDALWVIYALPEGTLQYRWALGEDFVSVVLETVPAEITHVDLPGAFTPDQGQADLLFPSYQGILYRAGDEDPWSDRTIGGGHATFNLSMGALLGGRGALMLTMERMMTDWWVRFGEDADGTFLTCEQFSSEVEGWTPREVRLYPADSSITAVAKRYRKRLMERGEFVGWEEKIARKPILENLFGALMAFIGYNKTPEVDYAASARKLYDYGFQNVMYYPVRMWNYKLGFLMGGDDPIWLSDAEIQAMKAVPGALVAPWSWGIEGLDDGSQEMNAIFTRKADGSKYPHWQIDDYKWYFVCTPYQVEEAKQRLAGDMRAMDWIHFDVSATHGLAKDPCFSTEHALHGGKPMSREADVAWTQKLFSPETVGNRIVSSEGMNDRFAPYYDIGASKVWPASAPSRFIPVPLTMLVLHDSVVHDWWELANYNESPGFPPREVVIGRIFGSGGAEKKAAMDALYGCPPNVFPFGRQYSWVDIATYRTFSFTIKLEDAAVQQALRAALPVTQLHRRIGKQELLSFEFVTPDCAVQSTVFADGTRIVANISNRAKRTERYGEIAANSWVEVKG